MKIRFSWISNWPEDYGGVEWLFEILPGIHVHRWPFGTIDICISWLLWGVVIELYHER